MMHYWNNLFFFFPFGPIFMIIFWGLIIWGIVVLFRHNGPHDHPWHHGSSEGAGRAMDVLKERYAKGEITKEQFEEMKKNIQ